MLACKSFCTLVCRNNILVAGGLCPTVLAQKKQSVAIIGGYAARNMQNITTIQTNANQMGEGNANITYEIGCLHLALLGQFIGRAVQSYYE
jgi:hypothetical protein